MALQVCKQFVVILHKDSVVQEDMITLGLLFYFGDYNVTLVFKMNWLSAWPSSRFSVGIFLVYEPGCGKCSLSQSIRTSEDESVNRLSHTRPYYWGSLLSKFFFSVPLFHQAPNILACRHIVKELPFLFWYNLSIKHWRESSVWIKHVAIAACRRRVFWICAAIEDQL